MHKSYEESKNATLSESDKAMDFFRGLDPGCYAQMKTTMHTNMTTGMAAPATVNDVYKIAANWVRTEAVMRPGQATTFVTTGLDKPIHKQKKT